MVDKHPHRNGNRYTFNERIYKVHAQQGSVAVVKLFETSGMSLVHQGKFDLESEDGREEFAGLAAEVEPFSYDPMDVLRELERLAECARNERNSPEASDLPASEPEVEVAAESTKEETTSAALSAALRHEAAAERAGGGFRSARELCEQAPKDVPWIARPWVVAGGVTELLGHPTLGGKTTFALNLSKAAINGEQFLGVPVAKTSVAYFSEEPEPAFTHALRKQGLEEEDNLSVIFRYQLAGCDWKTTVEHAVNECKRIGAKLVFFDTLARFADFRGDGENNAGVVLEKLDLLDAAVAEGIGVVLIRHQNKSGGQGILSGRGSSAFAAYVDTSLVFNRPNPDKETGIRITTGESRYDLPARTVIELVNGQYRRVDEEVLEANSFKDAENAILAVAPIGEEQASTCKELYEAAGLKRTPGTEAIKRLAEAGELSSKTLKATGSPKVYWVSPKTEGALSAGDPAP